MFADMKEELRCGNGGIISASLRTELKKNLDCGEQSILFLNRRGNSRMLLCGECGCVPQCPRCSEMCIRDRLCTGADPRSSL